MRKPIGITVPYRAPEDKFNEMERRSKVKQTLITESKHAVLIAEIAALTEIVRVLSDKVAELEAKQEQGEPVAKYSDIVSDGGFDPRNKFDTTQQQRTWVGLTDEDLAVCGDEDDVMLARYWERVCKEKNT